MKVEVRAEVELVPTGQEPAYEGCVPVGKRIPRRAGIVPITGTAAVAVVFSTDVPPHACAGSTEGHAMGLVRTGRIASHIEVRAAGIVVGLVCE